ncbi:MAG: DUF4255 domain-containing protein [Cytophagales bacterium]|nr:DUF4255 domain-containing protein [Cytophagales bacterium]
MILFSTIQFVRNKLNAYFRNTSRWAEDKAIVANVAGVQAGSDPEFSDKLLISLAHMNIEYSLFNQHGKVSNGEQFNRVPSPLTFNVDLLFSASANKYEESLKLLSDTIAFFQSNHFYDSSNSSGLPEGVQKLSLSVLDLDYHESSQLWSRLGAKYVPSVLYRMRLVVFDSAEVKEVVPSISSGRVSDN